MGSMADSRYKPASGRRSRRGPGQAACFPGTNGRNHGDLSRRLSHRDSPATAGQNIADIAKARRHGGRPALDAHAPTRQELPVGRAKDDHPGSEGGHADTPRSQRGQGQPVPRTSTAAGLLAWVGRTPNPCDHRRCRLAKYNLCQDTSRTVRSHCPNRMPIFQFCSRFPFGRKKWHGRRRSISRLEPACSRRTSWRANRDCRSGPKGSSTVPERRKAARRAEVAARVA